MSPELITAVRHLAAGEAIAFDADLVGFLQDLGLEYRRTGHQITLAEPPELLDADRITAAAGAFGLGRLHVHFSIDSTNTWQLDRAADPDFHASVCLAERQEAGKGRRGRRWVSPFGRNIYMSVGWYVPRQQSLSGLSIAVGIALGAALRDAGLEQVGLKWPNDLLLAGGKLGGILVEVASPTASHHRVVIGCGINLRLDDGAASQVDQDFSTVLDHIDVSRNQLVVTLLDSLLPALQVYNEEGFGPFASAWSAYDALAGEEVVVKMADATVAGTNEGIDEAGNLKLLTSAGIRSFNAGEVSLRRAGSE